MIVLLWFLFMRGNAALELDNEVLSMRYKIEGQIIVPESFNLKNGKSPSSGRVLVNYGEHVGFVRLDFIYLSVT